MDEPAKLSAEDEHKSRRTTAAEAIDYLRKKYQTKEYWIFLAFDLTGAEMVQDIYDRFYVNHPKHFPVLMLPSVHGPVRVALGHKTCAPVAPLAAMLEWPEETLRAVPVIGLMGPTMDQDLARTILEKFETLIGVEGN